VPLIDGGTQRLPRVVGMGRALDLILTGRAIDAAEALSFGLLTAIAEDPLTRALEFAAEIAAFPQDTVRSDRRAALEGFGLPLAEGLALEARLGRERIGAALEGAAGFGDRRD
jgi:enoyl-CoA hydratase